MRLLSLSAAGALLIDQLSKYLVIFWMELSRIWAIDVWPPYLNFRYGENRGINFGLFTGESDWARWLLIVGSLIVVGIIFYWVRRWHKGDWRMQVSAGLLIGGAMGNVVDRLLYGYVLDFLNVSCCDLNNPYVFNVADIFIFAGVGGMIVFDRKPARKNAA